MVDASHRSTVFRIGPVLALLLLVCACLAITDAIAGRVNPHLEQHLAKKPQGELIPVIIELEERANPSQAAAPHKGNREARGRAVVDALRDVADRSQKPVKEALEKERDAGEAGPVKSFWVFNGLATKATEKAIRRIAARKDVREVRFDAPIAPPKLRLAEAPSTTEIFVTWNIAQVRAPEVWELDAAYDGSGIVIGSFDTGVDGTHPDLAPRYRGNHAISWFDPYGEYPEPVDTNGHGTHTTGTALGGDASGAFIGVAPGAKWIAARGWDDSGNATVSAFHEIFEWFLAPGGNPANAPHVINNSWGMSPPGCYPDFRPDLLAWRAAGIFSAFASGNEGPGEETILSPGNYAEAFAVGATDPDDLVADFSGWGPSQCDGAVKPDISAPGVAIYSSLPGEFWFEVDGTSMATPHVTGAAAVLLSIDPTLDIDDLEDFLVAGVVDIEEPGVDNLAGAGRLDLLESARLVLGLPLIAIKATTPNALEAGTVPGRFTLTRTEPFTDALTLTYTVAGDAVAGSDYVALPGTVTFPVGASSVEIVVNPIDDTATELDEYVVVTLDPSAGYLTSPKTATVTIKSDELLPDMTVPTLNSPSAAGAGDTISVSDTTANTGPGPAPATTTRFYLSSDSVWDAGDPLVGSRSVPALASGGSDSGTVSVTIPAGTPVGARYLFAKADAGDATVEVTEENNLSVRLITIGPDLAVLSVTAPSGGAGQPMTVTDTVRNQGGGAAAATNTRYYLSTNASLEPTDTLLGSRSVAALPAGASDTGSTTLTIPAGTATGFYYLIAKADGDETLAETNELNNVYARSIAVGPDLGVIDLAYPSVAGAGLSFTANATTKNMSDTAAAASTTRFYLSTDTALDAGDVLLGSRSVPPLAAQAIDNGPATLSVPASTATGFYYLIAKADGDNALAETNEFNNVLVRVITIGPDLILTAFTAPTVGGAGQPITVSDTTRNQGGGAAPATATRYYLSTNATWDAGDVLIGSRSVAALAPSASDSGSVSVTIPAGTATGSYYVLAKADGADAVGETSEANNILFRALTVGPDLVLTAFSAPATGGAGLAITVSDTTNNASAAAAPATSTRFYLSANAALDAGDVLLGSRAVPALAASASSSGSVSLTIPAGTATGSYTIIAKADGDDALSETNETNNLFTRSIIIGPDLAVTTLSGPTSAGAGQAITVSDTTRNNGGGTAPATTTRFYLSTNSTWDAGDVALGGRAIAALAPGASSASFTSVTIPAGTTAGAYYLIARADGDAVLAETDEANNNATWSITLGPDLGVIDLAYPSAAGAGQAITVTDTTKNLSNSAAGASNTRFYLSADAALDAGDALLGSRSVPALAANTSNSGSASITIPAGTATGYYYLIAKADGDDALPETNEFNNALVRAIAIGPDLVVANLTAPALAGAGLPITVTDTTRNSGGGTTPASSTRFYLSSNSVLDAGDVLLGSRAVGALAAGASDTGSVSVTIPAGTAMGNYYLFAKADGDDALPESSETNNTLFRLVTVGPDLVVSSFTAPTTGGAGLAMTLSDTTNNASGATTPATNTSFYLSTNNVLDAGDVLLGSRAVPSLAPGASSSGSVSLTIPAGTSGGTWYVIAKADGDDALAETSEANNTQWRSVIIGPDLTVTAFTAPSGGAGQAMTVTDTIRNQGGGATPVTTTRYYLSANASLEAGDTLLGSRSVPGLAPGASDTGSATFVIPAGTATGAYYIIAKADGDDALAETNEANNLYARSITVGPDLGIANLLNPGVAGAGTTFTVTDTTRNFAEGAAPASTTRFYLSTNTALDGSDVLLGSRSVGALVAGASETGAASITIPAGTAAGYYYLLAKADGDDALAETNEFNNVLVRILQVTP